MPPPQFAQRTAGSLTRAFFEDARRKAILGQTPSLDMGLIPHIGLLRAIAETIEIYRAKAEAADETGEEGGSIYDDVFLATFKGFFAQLIRIQYRNKGRTIYDLVHGGFGCDKQVFYDYLIDFNHFAARLPIGNHESSRLVGLN